MRVGVLADTHGLLRPETLDALAGCELLIHAGDVGKRSVLDALRELAPVAVSYTHLTLPTMCVV